MLAQQVVLSQERLRIPEHLSMKRRPRCHARR